MLNIIRRSLFHCGLLVLLVTIWGRADAQNPFFPTREVSQILRAADIVSGSSNELYVTNDARGYMLSDASYPNKVKYKSNYTIVRLAADHGSPKISQPYNYKMVYQLDGSTKVDDTTYDFSIVDSLISAYRPDSLGIYQDENVKAYPSLYNAKLTIIQFYDANYPGPVGVPLTTVQVQNLFVELSMRYQPYLKTHYAPASMGLTVGSSYDAAKSVLDVSWSPSTSPYLGIVTPAQYELEWTYSDNYSPSGGALSSVDVAYDFRNNATRVITDTVHYQIPVVYPKGYIIYRVRMARVDSNFYRLPIYGVWSLSTSNGTVDQLNSSDYFKVTNAHTGDSLNWNYSIQFAEGGKYKHVQSYYDGLLKNRQTITRFNSDPNRLLVTEKIYDYEGRPEITTLPSVHTTTAFGYQTGVSTSSVTNAPYAPADFDKKPSTCPDEYTIPPFTASSIANKYYSSLNTDTAGMQKFVPRANGYPLVHTQLSPGFTDRVDIMGGAGDSLQVGRGHDVQNTYLDAEQMDLDRLLGTNAGYASFYTKTVSKDQNGQLSTSVKDFRGKPVLTAMVGASVDTSSHAIMFNDEVPNTKKFRQDKLNGAHQVVIAHQKRYDGSMYMDEDALVNIEYDYSFTPYSSCSGTGLTALKVAADYDYSVWDDCGQLELHKTGTIGTTGVTGSTIPVTSSVSDNVTLPKGKHTMEKTMTIRDASIRAAVDSFFVHATSCTKPEADFIKDEVENMALDCDTASAECAIDDDDPCEKMQQQMITEMLPGGKYASLPTTHSPVSTHFNPAVIGTYSIFDATDEETGSYRYMAPCISSDLNAISVSISGTTFTNLAGISRDSFINIYEHAGAQRTAIALALLPLHPEYCKLQNCFVDTFENRFKAFPNAAAAEQYGYFSLSDIVTKDAQLRARLTSIAGISDSLKLYASYFRMDTLAAELAFCTSDISMAYVDARKYFHYNIVNLIFPDQIIKDKYFERLRSFYLANRSRFKSIALNILDTSCHACNSTYRLPLIGAPLVPIVYGGNGTTLDTSSGSFYNIIATGGTPNGAVSISVLTALSQGGFNNVLTNPVQIAAYEDSAARFSHRYDSMLNVAARDSICGKLSNCFASSIVKGALRDSLTALISHGRVHMGQFTPEQVRNAIVSNGLSLSGLCHPYLFTYNSFSAGNGRNNSCADATFYQQVTDFFSSDIMMKTLQSVSDKEGAVDRFDWPDKNNFADAISKALKNPSECGVTIVYDVSTHAYHISFYDADGVTSTDSVLITLYTNANSPVDTTYPFFYSADAVSIDQASCYFEDPTAQGDGYIGRFMFRLNATRTDGSIVTAARFAGWNSRIVFSNVAFNPTATCIPCTQFKKVFKAFADTMTAYGAYAGDHPLFLRSLANFGNYRLNRLFAETQYQRFLNSCALADSMTVPAYGGYSRITFPTTPSGFSTFDAFQAAIQNGPLGLTIMPLAIDSSSGTQRVVLDYGNVPIQYMRQFDSIVQHYGGTTGTGLGSGVVGTLLIPQSNPGGSTVLTVLSGTGFTAGTPQSVYVRTNVTAYPYYRYSIYASGLTNQQLSTGVSLVDDNLKQLAINGYLMPATYPTVNQDYYKARKQQLLRYTYAAQENPAPVVLDTVRPALVQSNISAFSSYDVTYNAPSNPNRHVDLYYTSAADSLPGYRALSNILAYTQSYLGSGRMFIASTVNNVSASGVPSGASLMLHRCGDGLYWYRYFDASHKLYNVYIRVPKWVYKCEHQDLAVSEFHFLNGDTASRNFTLKLTDIYHPTVSYWASGNTDFDIVASHKLLDVFLDNDKPEPPTAASGEPGGLPSCEQEAMYNAVYAGHIRYLDYVDSFKTALRTKFYDYVMTAIGEQFWVEYIDKRFAFTLYHYDLAGNLIATVPPMGVNPLDSVHTLGVNSQRASNSVNSAYIPAHTKMSRYEYNTVNKPFKEITPDAGIKTMNYDAKGNVILSQNSEQKKTGLFTYMLYDGQNRLTETGQVKWNDCAWFADQPLYSSTGGWHKTSPPNPCACEDLTDSVWRYCVPNTVNTYDNAQFANKIRRIKRDMVVVNIYDSALFDLGLEAGMSTQENLRSRIAANLYFETVPLDTDGKMPTKNFTHGTYYSYDVAGNVKTLTHDFPELQWTDQRFKRVDYEYDQLSGKVNMLAYNRGSRDQIYQRYAYDADNRLVKAETSHDGLVWKRDAAYTYYQHGPLARVSLGDLRVQGIDYAYTIQGWLKSINNDRADSTVDMGRDGYATSGLTPQDVFATTIDYFGKDYQPIGNTAIGTIPNATKSLYNGNIARQTTDVAPFGPITTAYTYDQMNRIRKADYAKDTAGVLQFNQWYASAYKYDLDGNIQSLMRNELNGTRMDSLIYEYPNTALNNRLSSVLDYAPYNNSLSLDIKPFTTTGIQRFYYYDNGDLKLDLTTNNGLNWNIYGKLTDDHLNSTYRSLHFEYDGMGNRIAKKNVPNNQEYGSTEFNHYYVRDAQGNILAEYDAQLDWAKNGRIVTLGGVRTAVPGTATTSLNTWLTALSSAGYLTHDSFANYIIALGGSSVNYPAGYYLANSPTLAQLFVQQSPVPAMLCAFSRASGTYPLADALLAGMQDGSTPSLTSSAVLSQLSSTLFLNPDSTLRRHALEQLGRNVPELYNQIAVANGIYTLSSPFDSAHLAMIMDNIATGPSGDMFYSNGLGSLYMANPVSITNWLQAATSDSLYLQSSWATTSGYITMLRNSFNTYGDAAADAAASTAGTPKYMQGLYGAASWWVNGMSTIHAIATEPITDAIAYYTNPITYITGIIPSVFTPAVLDTALDKVPTIDIPTLATGVGVGLTPIQTASVNNQPAIVSQSLWLATHHIYGSSRLGLIEYGSHEISADIDYLYNNIYTSWAAPHLKGVLRDRTPWYSYALNEPVKPRYTWEWGHGFDSGIVEERHVLGQKEFELTNHLSNVQEVVSDNVYEQDVNGDSIKDGKRMAAIKTVYDYYPFGMLMRGRSQPFRTPYCYTVNGTFAYSHSNWVNLGIDGTNVSPLACAYGTAAPPNTNTPSWGGGVTVNGVGGGFTKTYSVPNARPLDVKVYVASTIGYVRLTCEQAPPSGSGYGTQWMGATSVNYSSYGTGPLTLHVSPLWTTTMSIKVDLMGAPLSNPTDLFTIDSVVVEDPIYMQTGGPYTYCTIDSLNVDDKYPFGYNGQMKVNEIAGYGNHNTALFWEYDTRLGRRWNLDPVDQINISNYAVNGDNPILKFDLLGNVLTTSTNLASKSDIKSLASAANQSRVKIDEDGKVSITYENANDKADALATDAGLQLLNDLVESDKQFYYEADDIAHITNKDGEPDGRFTSQGDGITDVSKFGKDSHDANTDVLPKNGYDGHVAISPHITWTEGNKDYTAEIAKARATMVFHELAENYERTHNKIDYNTKGGKIGAHDLAVKREKTWERASDHPGEYINIHKNFDRAKYKEVSDKIKIYNMSSILNNLWFGF